MNSTRLVHESDENDPTILHHFDNLLLGPSLVNKNGMDIMYSEKIEKNICSLLIRAVNEQVGNDAKVNSRKTAALDCINAVLNVPLRKRVLGPGIMVR
jgi:hypothetical protein